MARGDKKTIQFVHWGSLIVSERVLRVRDGRNEVYNAVIIKGTKAVSTGKDKKRSIIFKKIIGKTKV